MNQFYYIVDITTYDGHNSSDVKFISEPICQKYDAVRECKRLQEHDVNRAYALVRGNRADRWAFCSMELPVPDVPLCLVCGRRILDRSSVCPICVAIAQDQTMHYSLIVTYMDDLSAHLERSDVVSGCWPFAESQTIVNYAKRVRARYDQVMGRD